MSILAVETSCDDTCVAVVGHEGRIKANEISSQTVHGRFGGVVPEIASRHHLALINLLIEGALTEAGLSLAEIELVAVTQGPGLVGALLVGLSAAKALAAGRELPLAPVDHLQGHVASNFLHGTKTDERGFEPPFVCLIASGGHTLLVHVRDFDGFEVLGRTLDDAAGEAFDKGARMLGLSYPGGAQLEQLAGEGDPGAYTFPGSRRERARGGWGSARNSFADSLDFSFAGVKTALLYQLRGLSAADATARAADLAASYQEAIVDSLMLRVERALSQTGVERLAVAGGVAANGELRRRVRDLGVPAHIPERALCTDNAAMIASAARYGRRLRYPAYLALDAYATGERRP